MALQLTLFGSFQASRDGTPVGAFRGDKVRALLVYLAVEADRPHTRASLCGLLWPDQGDAAALHNLSQSLGRLRAALGDGETPSLLLHSTRQTIQWQQESGAEIDVASFVRLASAGTTAALEESVALYGGAFLPGFSIPGCPEFDEWLLLTREQCERLALTTLETLAERYLAAGAYREAEHAARRMLALDPWRESAHRQAMAAVAGAGRRGAALAQYETCVSILADELGLEPEAATSELYQAILDGTWQPSPNGLAGKQHDRLAGSLAAAAAISPATGQDTIHAATACELPAPLTPMLGRELELERTIELVERDGERLVTLAGMGGVGKTRLALEAAHQLAQQTQVCWVDLAGTGARHGTGAGAGTDIASELAAAIADALALSIVGDTPVPAQVLNALRGRELVLVLDNLEHLLAATPWLRQLLQRAPAVQLLVTSRERLNLDAEVVLPLRGLALPVSDDDPEAAAYSAVQLFVRRAARAAPSLDEHADLPAVVRLCRLLDGIPLGIELAAHWAGHYQVGEIAEAVALNLGFLTSNRRELPERQRSLRAVFAYSWRLLSPDEQQTLARTSVFRGSFSREAAQQVAEADVTALAALVDKSLLRQAGVGKYIVHELLRQFAAEQLAEQGDDEATHDRHAAYFLELLVRNEARLAGTASREAVATLRATFDNIRAAWYWAIKRRRWQLLLESVTGLMLYFRLTGPFQAMQPADDALAALETGEPLQPGGATDRLRLEAALGVARARVFYFLFRKPQAVAAAQRAHECAQAANDVFQAARAKLIWALALATQRTIPPLDATCAQAMLDQALGVAQDVDSNDPLAQRRAGELEAESMQFIGVLESRAQRFEQAKAWFSAAQRVYRRSGNEYCLESLFSFHANTFEQEGRFGQGRLYRQHALEYARTCGTLDGEGMGLHNLARALWYSGEYAAARQCSQQALAIRSRLGFNTLFEHHQLAKTALQQADFAAALESAQRAFDETLATSDQLNGGPVLVTIGDAHAGMRRWSEAQAAYKEAIALALRHDAADKILHVAHAGLARIALSQRLYELARMHAEITWAYLSSQPFDISYDPLRRYWTCYQAFFAAGDERAAYVLEAAYALLMRLAGAIEQPSWRRSFLENVPAHRAIVRRWSAAVAQQQAEPLAFALGA